MVKSSCCILNSYNVNYKKECKYDDGGYFIINGSEKAKILAEPVLSDVKKIMGLKF